MSLKQKTSAVAVPRLRFFLPSFLSFFLPFFLSLFPSSLPSFLPSFLPLFFLSFNQLTPYDRLGSAHWTLWISFLFSFLFPYRHASPLLLFCPLWEAATSTGSSATMKISSSCHKDSFVLLIYSVGTSPPLGHPDEPLSRPPLVQFAFVYTQWEYNSYIYIYIYIYIYTYNTKRARIYASQLSTPFCDHVSERWPEWGEYKYEWREASFIEHERGTDRGTIARLKTTSGRRLWRRVPCVCERPALSLRALYEISACFTRNQPTARGVCDFNSYLIPSTGELY